MLLNDKKILLRLQASLKADAVRYNIITSNFVFYDKEGNYKHVSLESTINMLKKIILNNDGTNVDDIEDVVNLYNLLRKLHDSYFIRRLKSSVLEFYDTYNLQVPRNLFIYEGNIHFTSDSFEGEKVIPYDDNFDVFLNKLREELKLPSQVSNKDKKVEEMAKEHQEQNS